MEGKRLIEKIRLRNILSFGDKSAIPKNRNVESIEKERVESSLKTATGKTQKGEYHKIGHGAKILEVIEPRKVRASAPQCERLFAEIKKHISK
jgi:hypothetical protein